MSDSGTSTIVVPSIPAPTQPTPSMSSNVPEVYFTPDQVAASLATARKEEKDKLYPQLESQKEKLNALEAQLATFNAERAEAQRQAAEAQSAAAEARRARETEELSSKDLIARQEREFNERLEAIRIDTAGNKI